MTICISVRVAEGLVLAADSAVVLTGAVPTPQGPMQMIIQNFGYANKVTHFKDYPIGILTWGLGSIEARSIQSLVMEFEYAYPDQEKEQVYTVREVANKLLTFIKNRYDSAYPLPTPTPPPKAAGSTVPIRPNLGLLVGGYSYHEFFSSQFVYDFPTSTDWEEVRDNLPDGRPSFGANWYGLTDALIRLFLGYDHYALQELINRGVDAAVIKRWTDDRVAELPLVFDGMPLQDAIDFAEYAARVVIGKFRFAQGPPLCGGDVDVAVITPGNFRWAQKKRWGIHHE